MKKRAFLPSLICFLNSLTATAPTPLQNYVPVVLVDSSGLQTPQSIYFLVHGLDPSGLPCYLVPDGSGICQYIYPEVSGSPSSADPSISKTFNDLPPVTLSGISDPAYLIYLPINSSSRGYLSVGNPMYLATNFNPAPSRQVLDIIDSSVTSIQDPNYYTWYQDFEFGLVYNNGNVVSGANLSSQIFLNLSWVDYFCLPMKLEVFGYPKNQQIQDPSSPISGFDPSQSRDVLMQSLLQALQAADNQGDKAWSHLPISYYQNQYENQLPPNPPNVAPYVRILAAKNSIALQASNISFQGPSTAGIQAYFPSQYANSSTYGPTSTTTFVQSAYEYYTQNTMKCQVFPAGGDNTFTYLFQITAAPNDPAYTLTFTNVSSGSPSSGPPLPPPLSIALNSSSSNGLTTEQLLSGSIWPFQPSSAQYAPYTNEFSKLISALFTIGEFPLNTSQLTATPPTDLHCTGLSAPPIFVNNNCGFSTIAPLSGKTNSYFLNPSVSAPGYPFTNGTWYNAYDQSLHSLQIGKTQVPQNPGYGTGYGYDYDDLLNMAGLINPSVQDTYANPVSYQIASTPCSPYIVITLGNLQGTPVLNINNDQYTTNQSGYNNYPIIPAEVQIGPLSANTTMQVTFLWYDGSQNHITPAPSGGQTSLPNIVADPTHPFQVQFAYNGVTYLYNVDLLRQVVTPSSASNPYSAIDQSLINGITFKWIPASPPNPAILQLNLSSAAPAWPG